MVQYRNEFRCDIGCCPIYLRHNEAREEDTMLSQGHLMDILDGVHCLFVHAVDAGYCLLGDYDCKHFKQRHVTDTRRALHSLRGDARMKCNKLWRERCIYIAYMR